MKRIIVLCLFLLSFSAVSHSQILISLLFGDKLNTPNMDFGLDVGGNMSRLTNLDQSSFSPGMHFGVYLNIRMSDHFYLNPSFYPTYQLGGRKYPVYLTNDANLDAFIDEYEITRNLKYSSLPVILKYKFNNYIFIGAGPQFGFLRKALDKHFFEREDNSLDYYTDILDQMKRLDAGITAGVSAKLNKGTSVTLSFRYYQGFLNTTKNSTGEEIRNRNFQFSIGIPVKGVNRDSLKNILSYK